MRKRGIVGRVSRHLFSSLAAALLLGNTPDLDAASGELELLRSGQSTTLKLAERGATSPLNSAPELQANSSETERMRREIEELKRRNDRLASDLKRRGFEGRWLWTIVVASAAVLAGGSFLILRLRHSYRVTASANAQLQHSQSELKRQTSILQSILHSMADGVVVVDNQGRFLLVNPAAERLVASGHSNVAPGDWSEKMGFFRADQSTMWPPSDLPLACAMRGEFKDNVEIFVRNRNLPAGRWLSVTARPLHDETGSLSGAVAVFSDVTVRKQNEEEIRAANLRLEQRVQERTAELQVANKELEAFSYSVSHDLRAPLRSVDGFSRALLDDYFDKLDDEGKENLQTVRAATQRMGRLIDDMLMLARVTRTELKRSEVDLSALATRIAEELGTHDSARSVRWKIEPGLTALADPGLIRAALENLLSNAWKFTGKQATALIEFGRTLTPDGSAFFVRDDGAGFDPNFSHKLFQTFQRLHSAEEFPGTGVGLASVQRIVCRHGGRVWAESRLGHGATFWFTLPG